MAALLSKLRICAAAAMPVIGACAFGESPSQLPPPGTVLSERSENLVFGLREVTRSQVNQPGFLEGIGHFVFVYFGEERLCQCDRAQVAISPEGSLVIYTDTVTGRLMLYRTASRERSALTQEYVGYPAYALWDLAAKQAVVSLSLGSKNSITVPVGR